VTRRYLVTGSSGCIGAWVVAELVREGEYVVALDRAPGPGRLHLLLEADELAQVELVRGDVTDLAGIERAVVEFEITNIIHLAALQVPFCRADPQLGARVNVLGTINMLEAGKRHDALAPVVYASSVAALDTVGSNGNTVGPATLYGVFKRANEATATVYWQDDGVASVGLRPHTVYGVGRDQGLTAAVTHAMLAAAVGTKYRIPYGGNTQLQYARDVARGFIAASKCSYEGAAIHNLPGSAVSIPSLVDAIAGIVPHSAGMITHDEDPLPFPAHVDASSFRDLVGELEQTALLDGIRETVSRFRQLIAAGAIDRPLPA
jgi:UDP-glucuronate 4-epimerase